jgi:hypothetical protein
MHTKNEGELKIFISNFAHFSHALALTILGRQRDGDGQNKLFQISGSKDSSSYIINRMNLIQS